MNRRTLLGALGTLAFVLFAAWIVSHTRWTEVTVPAYPSGPAARDPFYAAKRLVEELGGKAERRRALGELPEPDAVLMLVNWHWDLSEDRRERLEQWVESGGRLVLVGDLVSGAESLQAWSGLAKEYPEGSGGADPRGETPDWAMRVVGAGRCGLLHLAAGHAQVGSGRTRYSVCGLATGRFSTAREPDWMLTGPVNGMDEALASHDWPQAVRVAIGDGSLTWLNAVAYERALPFGNRPLLEDEHDHGLLLVELLQLLPGDHVVFLSEEQGASLLGLVWMHAAPAVLLAFLLVALALWRNATRFGPLAAAPDPARRSLAEQIRGTARFALATDGGRDLHAAMVRALHEAARVRIVGYEALKPRDCLAALAQLTGLPADALDDALDAPAERNRQAFRRAIALLAQARRSLRAAPGTGATRHGRRRARGPAAGARGREPIHSR